MVQRGRLDPASGQASRFSNELAAGFVSFRANSGANRSALFRIGQIDCFAKYDRNGRLL
jgi:hypothetical protein